MVATKVSATIYLSVEATPLKSGHWVDEKSVYEGEWEYGEPLIFHIDQEEEPTAIDIPLRSLLRCLGPDPAYAGECGDDHVAEMRGMAMCFEALAAELRADAARVEASWPPEPSGEQK